jgi:hypothetical protein
VKVSLSWYVIARYFSRHPSHCFVGAHLAELEKSFCSARAELEHDRDTQTRILQDSHSLELAKVASSNAAPSEELLSSHTLQTQILRTKFARLMDELATAQRAEYHQFVQTFAHIERQTPQSKRLWAGTPQPSKLAAVADGHKRNKSDAEAGPPPVPQRKTPRSSSNILPKVANTPRSLSAKLHSSPLSLNIPVHPARNRKQLRTPLVSQKKNSLKQQS